MPQGGALERQLRTQPPPSVARQGVVVEAGITDPEGNLEALGAGEVVLSVPSPEALERQADDVRRVLAAAGTGIEPLVVIVQAGEELREEEVSVVVESAERSPRPVILRVVRNA